MTNTKNHDESLKKLAREVADPELKSALLELANARDGLEISMQSFEKLLTTIDEFEIKDSVKEVLKNKVSEYILSPGKLGEEKEFLAFAYEMYAKTSPTYGALLNNIKEDVKSIVNNAYSLATKAYTDFVDHAVGAYNGVREDIESTASGVANVVNDALIAGAKKTTAIQVEAKATVDKAIDSLEKTVDQLKDYVKTKASDVKQAGVRLGIFLCDKSAYLMTLRTNSLDNHHKSLSKAETFFRNHAAGILMSSEIIREGRNAAAAEFEKSNIEKRYECSETNRNWCNALLKECTLYPDRTKEENVHAVNEKFAQMKEVALANLEKSGQNGPGKIASVIATSFDLIADKIVEMKHDVARELKDVNKIKEAADNMKEKLEEHQRA